MSQNAKPQCSLFSQPSLLSHVVVDNISKLFNTPLEMSAMTGTHLQPLFSLFANLPKPKSGTRSCGTKFSLRISRLRKHGLPYFFSLHHQLHKVKRQPSRMIRKKASRSWSSLVFSSLRKTRRRTRKGQRGCYSRLH